MAVYNLSGKQIANENLDYDYTVKSINHRGYNIVAPENTLPAYILSKKMGFNYVETDISFTSDGVAVLLHDATIDRTSNGSGNISQMTFEQVRQYDFGSWKSSAYAGTVIPTFTEFITLCRNLGLHPYIELKNNATYTEAQIQGLVDTVNELGMKGKVTWISFSSTYLGYVKAYDAEARLGYVANSVTSAVITTAQGLKTETNEVFVDSGSRSDAECTLCIDGCLPMETWTVDSTETIINMNPYVTGVSSNSFIAGKVLYENAMS